MKSYIALAFSLLISVVSFSQNSGTSGNNTLTKIAGKTIPNYKTQTNFVENKTTMVTSNQLAGSYQVTALPVKNNSNPLLNIGFPFARPAVNFTKVNSSTLSNNNDKQDNGDQRNLPLNKDGKLLSPDGNVIEFVVPASAKISNICYTPVPVMTGGNKNPACGFSVPCDDPANRDGANTATLKYFQIRWLVFTDGGPSTNIDQTRINALMAELNADYAPHNIIFCADPATFLESSTWYTHNSTTDEFPMKDANNVTPAQVINIYIVGSMSAGGYARFPYDPNGGTSNRGGIVLNRSNSFVGSHTVAHEMGHVFGLEHSFAGVDERSQCSNCYERVRNVNGSSNTSGVPTPLGGPYTGEGDQEGDWCSDTNPHDTYSFQCSTSSNPNGACDAFPWANAPVDNIMSYSNCPLIFSAQQGRRQHCMIDQYLTSWTAYGGGICGSLPPIADFVGSPTTWQSPSSVTFTDLSQPTAIVTGWSWDFNSAGQGGTVTPATFSGQTPPTIIYDIGASATCLDYEVTLTITGNGGDIEVKTNYITVCPPSGDCDTLDFQWETPAPTVTTYGLSPTDNLTGIPDAINLLLPTDAKGVYEGYVTPNLGVTTVGAIRVGLGNLVDTDDDITFQVLVYDDDGSGQPGALLGGRGGISPTALGVPGAGFFNDFWIPLFTPLTPTTPFFHVGVEIFGGGDLTDELIVMTSCDHVGPPACGPQGEADSSNNIFSSGFGYEKLMPVYGNDFDVDIIPMLGEYNPLPIVTGFTETVNCDTSFVTIFDTLLYHDYAGSALVGMSYTFASDGTVINTTSPLGTINRTYTTAGPETVTITAINDCGRADTTVWVIPYNFMGTPDAEFTKVQVDPICMGAPGVDFNANVSGYQDYTWDFGDGTGLISSGNSSSTNHVYAAPGLYYTSLTVTSLGYQPVDTFYLEDFESGWPAGYDRYSNDAFTPNAAVNPLGFVGGNATSWLPIDADGDGSTEATSCSWHTGVGQQADDWMLTTGIGVLPANQMLTWDGQAGSGGFPDGYEVRISTTQLPANVGNYGTLLMTVPAENSFRTTRSVDLSAYAGQTVFIAFRNNSVDQFLLYIDNIRVGTTGPGCTATLNKTDFVEIVDCTVLPPVADMNASDSTGCAPLTITYTDNTTVGDPATSWLWNFGDATFSTLQNPPAHLYATPGTYFVSFEACNAGGCSTEFLTVVVGSGITAVAGPDQNICGGTIATLAGNDPTPDAGVWALLSGSGVPTSPSVFNTGVTGLAPGLNQFTWTITGTGCVSLDTVDITIGIPANAGTDNTLGTCATGSPVDLYTLLGVADLGGTWIGPLPALTGGDQGTFTPGTNVAGTYQYIVTGTAPCADDTADVVVTITANDDPTFTYPDFCAGAGGVAGIINTPGGTFSFNPDPLDGSTIVPGTGAISNGVAGSIYNIQYLTPAGACQDSLTIPVNVITPANAGTDNALGICVTGAPIDLYTLLGAADLGGTWIGPLPVLTGGDQGTFTPGTNVAGTYQYVVTGTAPCGDDTSDVVVTITANDDATFTYADFCAGAGGVAGIINTPGGTFSFNPDPLDGSTIVPGTGAISNGVAGSAYNIQYLTPAGPCQDSSTIAVNVGTPANAGTDNTLTACSSDGTTDLFTLIGAADLGGTWTPAMVSGTGVFNPAVDPSATYQYIVTGVAPCGDDTSDVVVTVTPSDDPIFTYPDFCAGAGGVVGVINTPGGTFSFNPDPADGSTIVPGTGAIANGVGGSVYNIQYLTSGACPDSSTIAINVNNCIVLTAAFTTSSNTICMGDSVVFTDASSVGVTIWQWDFDSTSIGGALPSTAINQGPHTVFFNTAGTYTVELIVSDGTVVDTTSSTITVTDCSPTAAFAAIGSTALCEGDSISFNDLSTGTPTGWSWSFPGGTPATAVGANPGFITYATSGSYNVTLTVTNQYGTDSVVMTNLITVSLCVPPVAGIIMDDADGEICVDNCINFNYDTSLGGTPDTLNWIFEGGTPSTYTSNDPTEVINVCWNDTTNTFNVSVTASNAYGTSNASDTVIVHEKPVVNAGLDTTITIGTDGYLNAVATDTAGNILTGGIFTWTPPTNLSCTDCQSAVVVQPLDTTIYTVTYEDQYGCIVTDDVVVNLEIALNIGVPSGFSPGCGCQNDKLFVKGKIVIKEMVFTIYNRYGQKVFETTDIEEGWDGTHKEKELNPGVFVYYLKVTYIDGTSGELKGDVTLVR